MNIILAAVDQDLAQAWEQFCAGLPNVTVHNGSILEVECDALVSPANSYGYMDGGIDFLYSKHFGGQLEERLKQTIRDVHGGELRIGKAVIVETGDLLIPYMIAAPTMERPRVLRDDTTNPYLACRAVLRLIKDDVFRSGKNKGKPVSEFVKTVAFPGLGTGIGKVKPDRCAYQVRVAIEEVLLGKDPHLA